MPNILKVDKEYIVEMLKRKGQVLLCNNGRVLYPEDLEEMDINDVHIDLHA